MLQPILVSNGPHPLVCEHDVVPLIGLVRDVCQMSLPVYADKAIATIYMIQEEQVMYEKQEQRLAKLNLPSSHAST
jgi:hypothetical protein